MFITLIEKQQWVKKYLPIYKNRFHACNDPERLNTGNVLEENDITKLLGE